MKQGDFLGQKVVQASLRGQEGALVRWFAETLTNATDVVIANVASPPAGSGFSAENYLLDVAWRENGGPRQERFVLRRKSSGRQMFPDRDFGDERRVQELVAALGAAPVPRIVGHEDDRSILGERFYVMQFLEGEVPPTNPSHHEAGVLVEMAVDLRRKLWFGALRTLGRMHQLTHSRPEIEPFTKSKDGRSEFAHELDYWAHHYDLSAPGETLPLMHDVESWLRANEPPGLHRAICWGDARLGNAVFDKDGSCVGFFDWELFSVGDPVRDLAYWLYSDDHFVFANRKMLEGWPSRDESIAAYEEGAGFKVNRKILAFYRLFQGYLIVSTLTRLIQLKKEAGQMPADLKVGPAFTPVSYLDREWEELK